MTQHECARCGHDAVCSHGTWPDRHPVMATVGAMFALVFMGMLFSVYTLGATIMTTIVAVVVGTRTFVRARDKRAALARRAEWEHAQLMARQMPQPVRWPPPPAVVPPRLARAPRQGANPSLHT